MRNFSDTVETRKRSFISAFSTCMTVPLILVLYALLTLGSILKRLFYAIVLCGVILSLVLIKFLSRSTSYSTCYNQCSIMFCIDSIVLMEELTITLVVNNIPVVFQIFKNSSIGDVQSKLKIMFSNVLPRFIRSKE